MTPRAEQPGQEQLAEVGDGQDRAPIAWPATTVILRTSSMTLRSKNDSIARYEPTSTTIARPGGRIRNQTTTARTAIRSPTLTAAHASPNARRRATERRLGLGGVTKVEPRIVAMAGPQGGQPVATAAAMVVPSSTSRTRRPVELFLAGPELECSCRARYRVQACRTADSSDLKSTSGSQSARGVRLRR